MPRCDFCSFTLVYSYLTEPLPLTAAAAAPQLRAPRLAAFRHEGRLHEHEGFAEVLVGGMPVRVLDRELGSRRSVSTVELVEF